MINEQGKYVYAIIRCNPEQNVDVMGVLNKLQGFNNQEIKFVPYRDLLAVVSHSSLTNFDQLDKPALAQAVAVHNRTNNSLIQNYDVIPMRFGMIVENQQEILSLLEKVYLQFKIALEKVAGKAEYIVEVFWQEKDILKKIIKENPEIQKLQKKVAQRKILGLSSKIKLGKLIFEAIEQHRKKYIENILNNLSTHFPDFKAGKLMKTVNEQKAKIVDPAADKKMIMNYSFLIEKSQESKLESILNNLQEKYKDELKFKYIGPMAPYSFTAINFSLGNYELVNNARENLGLAESASLPEIKDAYYKLAVQYHPDKYEYKKEQGLLEENTKKMQEIIAARDVLKTYCNHYLCSTKEQVCSFKKEDVKKVVIINRG